MTGSDRLELSVAVRDDVGGTVSTLRREVIAAK
jgi:hypothetical protein